MKRLPTTGASIVLQIQILLWAVWIIGCGPVAEIKQEDPEYLCQGIIVATASRFISENGDEPFEQFDFIAMFPRYQTDTRQDVDALLETHVPRLDLPMDSCSVPEPQFPQNPANETPLSISLADVGDMFIDLGSSSIPIPTRTFPDLLKVIDGVIYSASPSQGVDFVPGQMYTIKTVGLDNMGSFEVVLEAPSDLGEITVDGIPPGDSVPTILSGASVPITWEGEGYGDEVIADINWSDMGLSWSVSCRMKDDGQFIIPAEITRQMGSELTEQPHEMRLSRIRQVSFAAPFVNFGDFSFVATTSFLIEFEKMN